MLFSTPSQFAVLALLLVIGWLFGFASHPGGKRWKRAYHDEAVDRAQERDALNTQLRSVDGRIATLEDEKAALASRNAELSAELARFTAASGPTVAPVAADSVTQPAAAPVVAPAPLPVKRGWFEWGQSDELSALRGVDTGLAERLKTEGVDRYSELGKLTDQEELALERRLNLPAGYLMKEQLREQARLLASGQRAEHSARFG